MSVAVECCLCTSRGAASRKHLGNSRIQEWLKDYIHDFEFLKRANWTRGSEIQNQDIEASTRASKKIHPANPRIQSAKYGKASTNPRIISGPSYEACSNNYKLSIPIPTRTSSLPNLKHKHPSKFFKSTSAPITIWARVTRIMHGRRNRTLLSFDLPPEITSITHAWRNWTLVNFEPEWQAMHARKNRILLNFDLPQRVTSLTHARRNRTLLNFDLPRDTQSPY